MPLCIDLNCDLGERPEAIADGSEEGLMGYITTANIACGGHAGDSATMAAALRLAKKHNLGVGAHPGYPDRANFGRVELDLDHKETKRVIYDQVRLLDTAAKEAGCRVGHVKPHGALYNRAAREVWVANAIAEGVGLWNRGTLLVGFAGSLMLEVWKELGFSVAGEAFADRIYEKDGSLRSRKFSDSLITDPWKAGQQALHIAKENVVTAIDGSEIHVEAQTICIHSDTPNAVEIAKAVRRALDKGGIVVEPLGKIFR